MNEKWFWEQFGIERRFESDTGVWYYHYPNHQCDIEHPPIDLNNLFKYATHFKNMYISFEREGNTMYCYGKYDEGEYPCGCPAELHIEGSVEINDRPYDEVCAEALYQAIYKAMEG